LSGVEARLRLIDRDLVLVGVPERARLDVFEEGSDGERRRLGSLSLARPEELRPLLEALETGGGPPSDSGPPQPFQPPPEKKP
jgi:hypothetical protein